MKFEFNSRFRNRNIHPVCGQFSIESARGANSKYNSVDPVCLAAPIFSWVPTTSLTGTIVSFSATTLNETEIIVNAILPLQATVENFLTGCILASTTLNLTIQESKYISSNLHLTVAGYWAVVIGQAVTIIDYSSFATMNVRAPLTFDLGKFDILYNERLDVGLRIKDVNLKTRRFTFEEASAPGWLVTDNVNTRDAFPSYVAQVLNSTNNSLLLNKSVTSVGDWVRIRLTNYSTQPISNSWARQIIAIDTLGTTITYFPPTAPAAIGSTVEILPFSYDNAFPIENYEIPKVSFFEVSLECLIIPNVAIADGDLKSCSYIGVELKNEKARQTYRHFVNSNNPLTTETCWIAKLDPYTLRHKELKFVVCSTEQKQQTMEINIDKPFELTLRLPSGKIFETTMQDTVTPQQTWSELNYTAIFEFKPIYSKYSISGDTLRE